MKISLNQVSVTYESDPVLRDITLKFDHGLYYLVGLNGSGKTTLLRCLSGLTTFRGIISFGGKDGSRIPAREKARLIAFVQQNLNIPFNISLYDLVLTGRFPYLNWLGVYQKEDFQKVDTFLEKMGISHLKNRRLDKVSGGELQKAFIARALIQETPIILLDEPAQSLDPKNKIFVYEMLDQLRQEGKTIICTTHDLEPLENPYAKVIGLKKGGIVLQKKGGEFRQELMDKVY